MAEKDLEKAATSPMSSSEMYTHLRSRIRAAKLENETIRFAMGLIQLEETATAKKKEVDRLSKELPKMQEQLQKEKEAAIASHNAELEKALQEAAKEWNEKMESVRKASEDQINADLRRTQTAVEELQPQINRATKARDDALLEKERVEAEISSLNVKVQQLNSLIAGRLKDEEDKIDSLKREQAEVQKVIAEMKRQRETYLRQFGASI